MEIVKFEIGCNDFQFYKKHLPDIRVVFITNATMSLIKYYDNEDELAQKSEQWISLLDNGNADLDYLPIGEIINTLRYLVIGMSKSFGNDYDQRIFLSVQSGNLTYTVNSFTQQGKVLFY